MSINEYRDQIEDKEFEVCSFKKYLFILVMKTFASYLRNCKDINDFNKNEFLTLDFEKRMANFFSVKKKKHSTKFTFYKYRTI